MQAATENNIFRITGIAPLTLCESAQQLFMHIITLKDPILLSEMHKTLSDQRDLLKQKLENLPIDNDIQTNVSIKLTQPTQNSSDYQQLSEQKLQIEKELAKAYKELQSLKAGSKTVAQYTKATLDNPRYEVVGSQSKFMHNMYALHSQEKMLEKQFDELFSDGSEETPTPPDKRSVIASMASP